MFSDDMPLLEYVPTYNCTNPAINCSYNYISEEQKKTDLEDMIHECCFNMRMWLAAYLVINALKLVAETY